MDILAYFATQSPITDPGDKSGLYSDVPKTAPEICQVIQGLLLDYRERYKYPIVNERFLMTNSRYAQAILKNVISLDKSPLTTARPEADRFTASSSDYACLFCSMARHNGIPARKRVGFLAQEDGTYLSLDIAEYYDGGWKQVGVDAAQFMSAAQAWQACRAGKIAPELFKDEEHKGLEVVRNNLILDVAAMNKMELLNWDRYGWMMRPFADFSDKAWAILDKAAELLLAGDGALEELHALYEGEEGIQVPRVIKCDTPLVPPHKVELTF